MFEEIFSIFNSMTASARHVSETPHRTLHYPKSFQEAARIDWANIQKDWTAVGLDMTNAINRIGARVDI